MDLQNKLALESSTTPSADGVEKLLLAELAGMTSAPNRIAVVDFGSALIFDELASLFPDARLVAHNDSYVLSNTIDSVAKDASWHGLFSRVISESQRFPTELFENTDLVLFRLPKSLDYLEEFAQQAAASLPDSALVLTAERTKFMTPSQNTALEKHFASVSASLGRFKSRALRAAQPLPTDQSAVSAGEPTAAASALALARAFPRSAYLADLDLTVVAHGGVFAGTKLDIGTRLLVDNLDQLLDAVPTALDFVDAGCGTGVLSARIAQRNPEAQILGTDVSLAAVLSTLATADANGLSQQISAVQDDALEGLPTASADVIVCNPPFHTGTALDTDVATRMFENAGRVLRPGGQLWTVYNSPLAYKSTLNKLVGRTQVVATNRKFTVTVSTAR